MTIQMLEYFVAVVKNGNFTKAAAECFVTQPTLSRSIVELETELGCALLVRTSRSVKLTPCGEVCYAEAQRVLDACGRLVSRVREKAEGQNVPIRTGYIIRDHLVCLLNGISGADQPQPVLDPQYFSCSEAKAEFQNGGLDLLVLPEPCAADLPDSQRANLLSGGAHLIVPIGNSLYRRESVHLKEVRDQPVVLWADSDVPLLQEAYLSLFHQAGVQLKVVATARKMGDLVAKLMIHHAVGFGTCSAQNPMEEVRYIPLEESREGFGVTCVWHSGDTSPQMERLKRIVCK